MWLQELRTKSGREKLEHLAQTHLGEVLLIAGVLLCVLGYLLRPVHQQELVLLSGQQFDLPTQGRVTVMGLSVRQDEDRMITGVRQGLSTVRVDRLIDVREYIISVYPPAPQGEEKQEVMVDAEKELAEGSEKYPITWHSSDENVVRIENGIAVGVSPGTAQVTETLNDFLTHTYEVTVPAPELEVSSYTLYPGERVPIRVKDYQEDLVWQSDSEAVKVNKKGVLTAKAPGEAKLSADVGGQTLTVRVKVAQEPVIEHSLRVCTDETAWVHVFNAIDDVQFSSANENVVKVDDRGRLTPVDEGTAIVTAKVRRKELTCEVTVYLTAEQQFRKNNYGEYQPDTSIAALAMLGMCDYYNDVMKADNARWYDTNLTSFSPLDTFEQERKAKHQGANCNSLLNWSWSDMGIKPGSGTKLYGDSSSKVHGYNSSNKHLKSLVDSCCTVISTHGATLRTMVHKGQVKPGDMLFMKIHTYIYRGEGTVFASAGDAKCRRKGKDLIFLNWINGSSSYDWKRRTSYLIRFKDDFIPRYYRDKSGEVLENPMYTEKQTNAELEGAEESDISKKLAEQEELFSHNAGGKPYGAQPHALGTGSIQSRKRTGQNARMEMLHNAGGKPYGAEPHASEGVEEVPEEAQQQSAD